MASSAAAPAQDWELWASALSPLHKGGVLIKSLTSWISTSHQQWFWFMDPSRSILFHNPSPNEWYSADPISQRATRVTRLPSKPRFLRSALSPINPPDKSTLMHATIIDDPSQDELSSTPGFATRAQPPIDAEQQSFKKVLWSHPFYKCLIGPINWSIPIPSLQIARALEENTLLSCCDGSYYPRKVYKFTWLGICNPYNQVVARGWPNRRLLETSKRIQGRNRRFSECPPHPPSYKSAPWHLRRISHNLLRL